jgi:hypothetical protein
MPQSPNPPAPVSVEEIGRRIRWPALPALLFVGIMAGLGVVALVGTRREPPILTGLPDDADVRAAVAAVRDVRFEAGPLRLHSALLADAPRQDASEAVSRTRTEAARDERSPARRHDEERPSFTTWLPANPGPEQAAAITRATERLTRAEDRFPHEPRIVAAFGALDLVSGSLERAEQRYRAAADRAPGYGEARLGLGVTLALMGARAASERERRRMMLQAIAQLAAVRARDPMAEVALYDRVLLLERVGRREESARLRAEFRRGHSGSEGPLIESIGADHRPK